MSHQEKRIDVQGSSCPIPLVHLTKAIGEMQTGEELRITGDDPIFERAVRDYCEANGHEVLSAEPLEGRAVAMVVRK